MIHVDTIRCFQKDLYSESGSCDGDFCIIQRGGKLTMNRITQTCVTGAHMPNYTCSLDFDDALQCYCKTDFCNSPYLFHSNVTILPLIECREVIMKEYRASACNKCIRKFDYIKYDRSMAESNSHEDVLCGFSGQSATFNLDATVQLYDRIGLNFYENGCYNVTMHPEQYNLYCRCTTANCNNPEVPIPFPIAPPYVSCYVSGYDADIDNAKYDTPEKNYKEVYTDLTSKETYHDEGLQCRGHFCFIAFHKHLDGIKYYKGCISSNEQGENKIRLGYTYVNDVPYYICNTDFCNLDIETTLAEAKNGTLRDNTSRSLHLISFCFGVVSLFWFLK